MEPIRQSHPRMMVKSPVQMVTAKGNFDQFHVSSAYELDYDVPFPLSPLHGGPLASAGALRYEWVHCPGHCLLASLVYLSPSDSRNENTNCGAWLPRPLSALALFAINTVPTHTTFSPRLIGGGWKKGDWVCRCFLLYLLGPSGDEGFPHGPTTFTPS